MAKVSWLVSVMLFLSFVVLGLFASLLGSITLLLALLAGYCAKIKFSWPWQFWSALGLLLGVMPFWAAIAYLTSDVTTSIIFSLQIIGAPLLWLAGAWLQVRFGHRWWSQLRQH